MLKTDFVNDRKDNFLIIKYDEEDLFSYNMITENQIYHFLPVEKRYLDGDAYLYYKITGMQTLQTMWMDKPLTKDFFETLIESIKAAVVQAQEFFLEDGGICLHPDKIFWNYDENIAMFAYLPGQSGGIDWIPLADFFVDRVDYSDKEVSDAVYRFYENVFDKHLILDDFLVKEDSAMYLVEKPEMAQEEVTTIEKDSDFVSEEFSREDMYEQPECASATDIINQNKKKMRKPKNQMEKTFIRRILCGGCIFLWCASFVGTLIRAYQGKSLFFPETVLLIVMTIILLIFKICMDNTKYKNWEDLVAEKHRNLLKGEFEESDVGYDISQLEEEAVWDTGRYSELSPHQSKCEKTICVELHQIEKRKLYGIKEYRRYKFELSQLPCTLGKDENLASYIVAEPSVSRMHARFYEEEGAVWLQDLNSTNGTFQNGIRLKPNQKVKLEMEDEIVFGQVEFVYL